MKAIVKANKKAWPQIKQIKESNNMLSVESAINNAMLNTFGLRDLGLIKIAMRKGQSALLKAYGAHKYGNNFGLLKAIRNHNFDTYSNEVMSYLVAFIPERLRSSEMYKKFVNQ